MSEGPAVLRAAAALELAAPYRGRLSPGDKIIIAYLTIVAALMLVFNSRVDLWPPLVAAHAAAAIVVAFLARVVSRAGWMGYLVRCWYPVVLIPITFKELEYLIPRINPRDMDWELAAIDLAVFGAHPTIWLERFTHPILTELLQLSYICYYFFPVLLGAALWRKRELEKFHFCLFAIVLGFYLSYLGYMAVPAIGPRFILADQQSFPLKGILLFDWIHNMLNRLEGVMRDCFPSGHTAVTLLVLYYAGRFHRLSFRWMLLPGSALIFSTVYLRYHYVVDVIAGALLALAVVAVAERCYRWLSGPK
jgi:membrane-associated phospholipid phosphatase